MQAATDHTRAHTRIARLYRLDQLSCMQGTRPQKMQWLRDASACACREDGGRGCTLGPHKCFPVITHVLSWIKSFEYPAAGGQRTASDGPQLGQQRGAAVMPQPWLQGARAHACGSAKCSFCAASPEQAGPQVYVCLCRMCSGNCTCSTKRVHHRDRALPHRTAIIAPMVACWKWGIIRGGAAAQLTGLVPAGAVSGPQAGTVSMRPISSSDVFRNLQGSLGMAQLHDGLLSDQWSSMSAAR